MTADADVKADANIDKPKRKMDRDAAEDKQERQDRAAGKRKDDTAGAGASTGVDKKPVRKAKKEAKRERSSEGAGAGASAAGSADTSGKKESGQ